MRTTLAVLATLALPACAGSTSQQPAARYAGQPFDLQQRGDRITGQVCGMDLNLDVQPQSDGTVALSGFIDGRFPVHLTARADGDQRAIAGALGTRAGDAAVDVRLTSAALDGRVGWRRFQLAAQGDTLSGTMQIAGAIEPSDAVLEGRAQLQTIPLATQAALVPTLLSCNVQRVGHWGRSSLQVRVGGRAGALPHQSSSVYTGD
jgi:hypothetical protein